MTELAKYVREHSCWRADPSVTVADWDRGILAIEAEATLDAYRKARAAVEEIDHTQGFVVQSRALAAIDALIEGVERAQTT